MDKMLNNVLEKSKFIALKYVKDIDVAEEIAQLSSIQLYLNYDKIDKAKLSNWLFTVTRNLCMDFHRERSKSKEILVDPLEMSQVIAFEKDHTMEELDFDVYDFITEADKNLLKKYYNQNVAISKLAKDFKIKQNQLKRKIYSLENEIKQFHLINSDVVYFNPVPTTKLTKKIDNFIKVLVKALKNNDLVSMKRYCKDAIIHDSIEKIKIKSFEVCKIKITKDNAYQLVIGYLDFNNQVKFFNVKFIITELGGIQVLEMPIMPKRVLVLDKANIDHKKSEKELSNRKGLYNNKLGSVDDLEKKGMAKVVQTKDDFS